MIEARHFPAYHQRTITPASGPLETGVRLMTDTAVHVGAAPPPDALPPPRVPEFSIVPVIGIPIAAALLVGLIVAIATNSLWALTFFHVGGGGLWTSIDLFLGLIIGPILGRLSIPARVEFTAKFMPKMVVIMPTLVAMTLGSGFQLARHLGNLSVSYPHHGWLVASYIIVGVMAIIALGLLEPANLAVLFELKKPQPNGERIGRLMRVFIYTAGITGLMQIATIVIMTFLASR
jgi:hypothetical protein